MARTERHKIHNREAVAEMPEWLKEKNCPHKKQYMSGKRIQPKNLTGREKLTYMVDGFSSPIIPRGSRKPASFSQIKCWRPM